MHRYNRLNYCTTSMRCSTSQSYNSDGYLKAHWHCHDWTELN